MTKPQINVTPLIDVLLVLLIIFMVVTPMKPSAFDAKIPSEPDNTKDVGVHPDTLVVIVNRDASLRLNKEQLTASIGEPTALIERLKNVFQLREQNLAFTDKHDGSVPEIQRTVFIKAPKNLDYGSVARVLDAVKMSGASPVSLQIDDLE
jgi:biopolymer transport protein ExbD